MESIKNNLLKILDEIKEAEIKAHGTAGNVKLCAVSKFHPVEAVYEAMEAGQMLFGENRVQEAYSKFTEINSNEKIIVKPELHIIGSLQLNKVKKAVEISECIESVDRIELLQEIEKQCSKLDKKIRVLFEVHTGEDSKAGFVEFEDLCTAVRNCAENQFPHIIPAGFMTMAPFTQDEKLIRKSFETLRNYRDKLQDKFKTINLNELSMGMSSDYKIAIEEGSTIVRIGTAIFGERIYQ